MKHNIIAAVILAAGIMAAGFMIGGRYYFIRIDECAVARGDRWTGEISTILVSKELGCEFKHLM